MRLHFDICLDLALFVAIDGHARIRDAVGLGGHSHGPEARALLSARRSIEYVCACQPTLLSTEVRS